MAAAAAVEAAAAAAAVTAAAAAAVEAAAAAAVDAAAAAAATAAVEAADLAGKIPVSPSDLETGSPISESRFCFYLRVVLGLWAPPIPFGVPRLGEWSIGFIR